MEKLKRYSNMNILVDADACPVVSIIVKIAKMYHLNVTLFTDTSHMMNDGYSEVVMVDKGRDAVDIAIVNKTCAGDIIITQDYGLAAMILAKNAKAINQNGMMFTNENIDRLLFQRHMGQKIRNAGGRTPNMKKRIKENDVLFEKSFRKLIEDTYSD